MSQAAASRQNNLTNYKEQAVLHRAQDAANYIGPIDMEAIAQSYEESFERFVFKNSEKVDFETFISQCENLDTIVMTAHPTFFKSKEEGKLLSKLFTAYAKCDTESAQELESQIRDIQANHPYQDPTTDEEGEQLYAALENTVNPGRMMQQAMMNVAKKHYPDQWKQGRYSPFNRTIWQKHDRDGRVIPINTQLSEAIRQRRLGLERLYLPQIKEILDNEGVSDPQKTTTKAAITNIKNTIRIYQETEQALDALDGDNLDMSALQDIINDLESTKDERITHPDELTGCLQPLLDDPDTPNDLFEKTKMIFDDLHANGLCFATPTHRINAEDVHHYLEVERLKNRKDLLRHPDQLSADRSHFHSTEEMIANARDQVSGRPCTEVLAQAPANGRPIHEMMMVRRLVFDLLDSHTIEKIDIAEAHNAMTQRALRLAAKQYGVSDLTDIGLLHEDSAGIDNAREIYERLLQSGQFWDGINERAANTNKKRPRLVLKIGYSDFAKQHSSPGGKPSNEKCLLEIMQGVVKSGKAGKIDLDIEFAGGEGPGRRVNPKGYEYTLKETVTPAVLAYAAQNGIALKYRETIQGGDGCILLGTEESAAKVMATQLDHLSKHTTANPNEILQNPYFQWNSGDIEEHQEDAREAYHALYNDPDFALLMKLYRELCVKGGSRKVNREDVSAPHASGKENGHPLAGFRAIGFNAASLASMVHLTPIYGQGSAFYKNESRTQRLIGEVPLFKERMMTAFMVRDLHMDKELERFIELYNPEYWRQFPRFDESGQRTTEAQIARRLDRLYYADNTSEPIYSRLERAVRKIQDDLEQFDQIRQKHDFSDIETTIAQGDYKQRTEQKRALLAQISEDRFNAMRNWFIELEATPVHSTDYTREIRSDAIGCGMRGKFDKALRVLDPKGQNEAMASILHIKEYNGPIADMCYNT